MRTALLVGVALGLCACTASKDIHTAQQRLRSVDDFRGVNMKRVAKPLNEYRKAEEDEVLYHLEHGMLAHYRERWDQSSRHFKQAQHAIERNFTKSINRNLQSMLVNDLQLAYHGEAYEDIYLNAVKALNYLHQNDLDGAMVEARRVTHELEQLSDRYKGLAESVSRDTAQAAVKKVDRRLDDVNLLDQDEQGPVEVRQNSALGRFLTTVLYAKTGSPDDARIERRKLRTALQDQGNTGFLTALALDREMASPDGADAEPSTESARTTLAVRLTSPDLRTPPTLTISVNGTSTYTLPADSLTKRDQGYAIRVADVPASRGDSVSIELADAPSETPWLEVWSDSLQYRGPLRDRRNGVTVVLGRPSPHTPSSEETSEGLVARLREKMSLETAELSYAVTRAEGAELERRSLRRTIQPVPAEEGASARVTERVGPAMGTPEGVGHRVDTVQLSDPTLVLERYSQRPSRGTGLSVRREGGTVSESVRGWRNASIDVPRVGFSYGEGMGVEVALSDRSLSVGDEFSLPVYVSSQRSVRDVRVQVLGTDSVSTPAGTFGTYEVRVVPPAAHQGTARLYLRREAPHHVVHATERLPVLSGGRRDTLVMKRTLTEIGTPSEPTSPSPPVALRGTETPPSDLASVPFETSTPKTTSASASTSSEGSSLELSNGVTYNTMLVSFSGRGPVKRERKFSFNFTIEGEEFQLDFAIPVLELHGTTVDRVRAIADGDTLTVPLLEKMQSVAETMFDEKKSIIYTRAVIRSFLKAAATKGAQKLAEEEGNAGMAFLAKKAGQFASQYVAQADTRGWQTMPGFAWATVAKLPPGTHEVTFEFLSSAGAVLQRRTRQVEVGGPRDLAVAESIFLK